MTNKKNHATFSPSDSDKWMNCPGSYNNVAIHTITFFKFDDEGNELENEDGTTKEFKLKSVRFKPLEYLCEDLDADYLEPIEEQS